MRRKLRGLLAAAVAWFAGALPAGAVNTIATFSGSTSLASSFTYTATGACAAGSMALVAQFNNNARPMTSISDSRSNTYTQDTNAGGGSGSLDITIARSVLTTGIQVGDTLTIGFASSINTPYVIWECLGVVTSDATGKGSAVSASAAAGTYTFSDSGSPPTNAARVWAAFGMNTGWGTASAVMSGWTQQDTAVNGSYGVKLYYQDVSAGATSTGSVTSSTSSNSWIAAWHSMNGSAAAAASHLLTTLGVGQ